MSGTNRARPESQRRVAVVDIDGVIADVRHRLHHVQRAPKNWDAFFAAAADDPPHEEGLAVVRRLARDHEVVFLTGRPDRLGDDTRRWLRQHGLDHHRLVMRPEGDRRPAARLKVGRLHDLARDHQIAVVVDDDPVVVAAVDDAGFPVLHADWGARTDEGDRTLLTAQEVEGRT